MPSGAFNWSFSDVAAVLKKHGFRLVHIEGSHYFYEGIVDGKRRTVQVAKHGSRAFKPRTFKSMMLQSGLPKKAWGLD
ncbi:MAG TPA: type II toxin-antitoxin system HicA family toxin [Candidatus Paceibacterota bacterium]|nr:type II toxin-antitoxin system HicA family toxin [Candidatus Paceibacterota bacterium]